MNANNDQRQWFIDLANQANQAAGPGRMAGNQLQTIDLPNRKQEAWRYTDLTRLYQ